MCKHISIYLKHIIYNDLRRWQKDNFLNLEQGPPIDLDMAEMMKAIKTSCKPQKKTFQRLATRQRRTSKFALIDSSLITAQHSD